ncbi:hypothetical protein BD324DRAFT_650654 [Kockovaella imperatae]|uniref:Uncharacterized protein n=1 Tax=Kockovaella imperatae TaxID=4999 RepID=A0A1Y1UGE2_9TREE|nr:hypothetical protein BD324DRAFT_650654 [Kockovaella imperatae]ORX37039.1 hypothetical protein BD324DRAFT_650654 [Kockovaella imperatae]
MSSSIATLGQSFDQFSAYTAQNPIWTAIFILVIATTGLLATPLTSNALNRTLAVPNTEYPTVNHHQSRPKPQFFIGDSTDYEDETTQFTPTNLVPRFVSINGGRTEKVMVEHSERNGHPDVDHDLIRRVRGVKVEWDMDALLATIGR